MSAREEYVARLRKLTGLFIIITVMVGVTAVLVVLYRGGVI